MAEKAPDQKGPSPEEQKKQERLKQQMEAKQKELGPLFQQYSALGQKLQELQKKAQEGDENAAAQAQEIQKQLMGIIRKIVETLAQLRAMYEEAGAVDQFDSGELGERYEQFQAMLEG
jgi:uncharacterized protein YoxC